MLEIETYAGGTWVQVTCSEHGRSWAAATERGPALEAMIENVIEHARSHEKLSSTIERDR